MLDLLKHFPLRKKEKPKSIKILQWVYLFILVLVILSVYVLHNTDTSFLQFLRLPLFFKDTQGHLGVSYISSLTVYHFTFAYFILIFGVDVVSFFNYSNEFLRRLSLWTTVFGLFIFGSMLLYFFYSLVFLWSKEASNVFSALVFFLFSTLLFLLDLATYLAEEGETKLVD